jgi:NhaP-type Na+/H+ or K+/H+ antiporter
MARRAMVAWFGIHGIGSVFHLLLALRHGLPAPIGDTMGSLTPGTAAASIVVHGLSAQPLMRRCLGWRQGTRRRL